MAAAPVPGAPGEGGEGGATGQGTQVRAVSAVVESPAVSAGTDAVSAGTEEPEDTPEARAAREERERRRAYHVETRKDQWERAVEIPLAIGAFVFLAAYALPILWLDASGWVVRLCTVVVQVVWLALIADYEVRFVLARHKMRFFWHNVPDLLVLLLPVIRQLRILRLVALLPIIDRAGVRTLRGRVVTYVAGGSLLIFFVGSLALTKTEAGAAGATIRSFGDALWFSVATMTTVGYGDVYPVTTTGKFIASGLMLGGLALVGTIAATIASYLVSKVSTDDDDAAASSAASAAANASEAASQEAVSAREMARLTEEVRLLRAALASPTVDVGVVGEGGSGVADGGGARAGQAADTQAAGVPAAGARVAATSAAATSAAVPPAGPDSAEHWQDSTARRGSVLRSGWERFVGRVPPLYSAPKEKAWIDRGSLRATVVIVSLVVLAVVALAGLLNIEIVASPEDRAEAPQALLAFSIGTAVLVVLGTVTAVWALWQPAGGTRGFRTVTWLMVADLVIVLVIIVLDSVTATPLVTVMAITWSFVGSLPMAMAFAQSRRFEP